MSFDLKKSLRDPRTQKRVTKVLAWCKFRLHPEIPNQVPKQTLDTIFTGSANPLSACIRNLLLIKFTKHAVGSHCCSWLLDEGGFEHLAQLLAEAQAAKLGQQAAADAGNRLVTHIQRDEILSADQLRQLNALEFDYSIGASSNRLIHPFQNFKKAEKIDFWNKWGLPNHYDIQCCAPTLLLQKVQQLGMSKNRLPEIRAYVADRKPMRARVQALTGCKERTAKEIVNALFNGARLACNEFTSIFKKLGRDEEAMARLQADEGVSKLRLDIKRMWDRLSEQMGRPFTKSSDKWRLYFQLERQVLNAMTRELRNQGAKHFTEHDGFSTDFEIDIDEVQESVFQATGFIIVLEKQEVNIEVIDQETGEIKTEKLSRTKLSANSHLGNKSSPEDLVKKNLTLSAGRVHKNQLLL